MATYCGAKFLDAQLRSLAQQSLLPAELVVTDDGSPDDTLACIAEFAKTAPFPVRLHRNERRLGYRANFMRAVSLCQSEFVACCDQDDVWEPTKLETCLAFFKDEDVLLAYHDALVFDSDSGHEMGRLSHRAAPSAINGPLSLGPWQYGLGFTLVFKRELLVLNSLWSGSVDPNDPREPMAHDQWFCFLANALGSVAYCDKPLVRYRQHASNVCGWERRFARPARGQNLRHKVAVRLKSLVSVNGADASSPFEQSALSRAEVLRLSSTYLTGLSVERAEAASQRYALLERRYAARRRLYSSCNILERLLALRELLNDRSYGGGEWAYIPRLCVKDACLGVPFGRLLLGRAAS